MNIYNTQQLEQQIEEIAINNDGEIPEELFKLLVESETKTEEQVENLINYIVELKYNVENLQSEKMRIDHKKQVAQNKIDNIEKYLLDYVENKGKMTVGSFTVTTRKSKKVILSSDFYNLDYGVDKTTFQADKKLIKQALDNNEVITGAELQENKKISIK
jgi:hypothetical protein